MGAEDEEPESQPFPGGGWRAEEVPFFDPSCVDEGKEKCGAENADQPDHAAAAWGEAFVLVGDFFFDFFSVGHGGIVIGENSSSIVMNGKGSGDGHRFAFSLLTYLVPRRRKRL